MKLFVVRSDQITGSFSEPANQLGQLSLGRLLLVMVREEAHLAHPAVAAPHIAGHAGDGEWSHLKKVPVVAVILSNQKSLTFLPND